MNFAFSMRFGRFDLVIDCHRFIRIINTALLVRRDARQSPLTDQQIANAIRRIQVALDVLTLRLQARAPLNQRGQPPSRLPRQTQIFMFFREQFQHLIIGIDARSAPHRSADLDTFINTTIAGWFTPAVDIMLR